MVEFVKIKLPSTPIAIPVLFLILNPCSTMLTISDLKNFPAATSTSLTVKDYAFVALPQIFVSKPIPTS